MSNTALEPQSLDIDLSTPLREQLRALRAIREIVRITDDPNEATTTAQRARLIREWVKISKAANEIAIEATRLEMTALRRLAQLNAFDGMSSASKAAARGFAGLSDEDFATLIEKAGESSTAIAVWRSTQREEQEAAGYERGQRMARGEGHVPSHSVDTDEMADAASKVLAASLDADRNLSVTEAALRLSELLDISDEFHASAAVRNGLRNAIRSALHNDLETEDGVPNFVTYRTTEAGWVHVPFNVASVEQVESWALFRQSQANDYVAAAAEAISISDKLKKAQAEHPKETSAKKLWKLAQKEAK